MTDKELSRLRRTDLLEMLISQGKELDELQAKFDEARAKLEERDIIMDRAGSIAEASVQFNDVIGAAQRAADQYIANVQAMCERQQRESSERRDKAEKELQALIADRNHEAEQIRAKAGEDADLARSRADAEAADIIKKARQEAERLVAEARQEAEKIVRHGKKEAYDMIIQAAGKVGKPVPPDPNAEPVKPAEEEKTTKRRFWQKN